MSSRPGLVTYRVESPEWRLPDLTIAVLSDFHTCLPWTPVAAIRRVVDMANATGADLILLGGDFLKDGKMPGLAVPAASTVRALEGLSAPLGVFAVLGNHDWKDCRTARATGYARNSVAEAFGGSALRLLRNEAVRVGHGAGFWLVGFDSQRPHHDPRLGGFHDPEAAFREVPEGAPAILLAHEPDWFGAGDRRAFLQISGHTHGGQANLFGWRPLTPSAHGPRYAWGHVREGGRQLIVSGGIGYSGLPLRILQPPEITVVTVTGG
ncbi:MAG: metallophosphoesterase [Paracoccaceae bacterium]